MVTENVFNEVSERQSLNYLNFQLIKNNDKLAEMPAIV